MQGKSQYKFCPSCATSLQNTLVDGTQRLTCPNCGFIFWDNPKPTTSIILAKESKVLLLKRSQEPFKGYWVLPGGYVEHDEDPQVTIVRETKEETGLHVIIRGIVWVYLIDTDPRGNSIDIVFEGTISGGAMTLREHARANFFAPNKLPEIIAYRHREAIAIWQNRP